LNKKHKAVIFQHCFL